MSAMPNRSNLRRVTHYLWSNHLVSGEPLKIERFAFWDGSTYREGKRQYVRVDEALWAFYGEPDHEILECGHEKPLRMRKPGHVESYNERRRCVICAIEQSGGVFVD